MGSLFRWGPCLGFEMYFWLHFPKQITSYLLETGHYSFIVLSFFSFVYYFTQIEHSNFSTRSYLIILTTEGAYTNF